MNQSQKWMEIQKRFSNTGQTGRCPDCGNGKNLEVIISEGSHGGVTFYCKECDTYTPYDVRRVY